MKRFITPIFLACAGSVSALIGAAILLAPRTFFAANDIVLGADPNLMSEIRAPGGLLLVAGMIMIASGLTGRLTRPALMIAAIGFGAYGVSRLVSIVFDGMPSSILLAALIVELVFALAAWVLIIRQRKTTAMGRKGVPA
ncbi:MAG: DUF4345 domain-containing protein [Pseudomonadota bacterium]